MSFKIRPDNYVKISKYAVKSADTSSHGIVYREVLRHKPRSVLDVGCGDGAFSSKLVNDEIPVSGVDRIANLQAVSNLTEYVAHDLEEELSNLYQGRRFDIVLFADVLEHLSDPSNLLIEAKRWLNTKGRVIISLPNMGHWYPRARVASGNWGYDERGILDKTHLRFYSIRSAIRLCDMHGYAVLKLQYSTTPWELIIRNSVLRQALLAIDRVLVRVRPNLFAYQVILTLELKSKKNLQFKKSSVS